MGGGGGVEWSGGGSLTNKHAAMPIPNDFMVSLRGCTSVTSQKVPIETSSSVC